MERLAATPEPWNRLKLQLRWIVFEDGKGNFVMVDPQRPRPLGLAQNVSRPPTVYFAATDAELSAALETMLDTFERSTTVDRRHLSLVERTQETLDRFFGHGSRKAA